MEENNDKNLVSTTELAVLFGLTDRRIQQLTADGTITAEVVTVNGHQVRRYDLLPTVHDYVKILQDKAAGREQKKQFESMAEEKMQAEIDYKRAKAKIAELELDEIEGRMHRSEDVERMTTDLCLTIRSDLLALPGRLASDLADINDAAQAAVRIKEEVSLILEELSTYKYDEKKYIECVRERRGTENKNDDNEDDEE